MTFFAGISCQSVPLQRSATSLYLLEKTPIFLHPFYAALAQGTQILTREI